MPVSEYSLPINESSPPPFLDTMMVITPSGQPTWKLIFQARQISQTLEVIAAAQEQQRDVNGILVDLSNPVFRKYQSTVTCPGDVRAPPFDALWPGMLVTVAPANLLAFPVGNVGSPARTPVEHSEITLNGMTYYQPLLTMMVRACSWTFNEWRAQLPWSLKLEEI
jgi:hypothetical protein